MGYLILLYGIYTSERRWCLTRKETRIRGILLIICWLALGKLSLREVRLSRGAIRLHDYS